MELQQHPLSASFPAMPEGDFAALSDDIAKRGLLEPVITLDGMVLDGWHRYAACKKLGRKCPTQPFTGDDPIGFVLARNLHRRHLTASQRAAAIVAATNWKPAGRPGKNSAAAAEFPDLSLSSKDLAAKAEVSTRTIEHAKAAHKAGLGQAVKDGKLSAEQAAEVAKLPEQKRARAVEAISRGDKPERPKGGKPAEQPPSRDEQLVAKIEELQEALAEAADEIARLSAIKSEDKGEAETLIKNLQAELRAVKAKRDDLLRENNELRKQVKFLERQARRAA